jgi:phospholipase/lecithinase/hemolysin
MKYWIGSKEIAMNSMRATNVSRRIAEFASTVALAMLSCTALAASGPFDRLVTFGGSLSDTGNAFVWLSDPANAECGTRQNVPPYAALDELFTPDGPYARGGHTFSNGANWVQDFARDLGLAGNARPALQNAGIAASNYAVGGARAVPDFPCRINLPAQVSDYLADFPQTSPNTLVAIEIGGNDVRDALIAMLQSGGDPAAAVPFIQNALASLGNSIGQLYATGARHFLVLNVPDLGKSPAVQKLAADLGFPAIIGLGDELAKAYNGGLALLVQGLNATLPGIDVRIVDIYAKLNDVVAHPARYGFTDVTTACITPNIPPFACFKPDTHAFWDGIHPTKALHAVIAQEAIAVVSGP